MQVPDWWVNRSPNLLVLENPEAVGELAAELFLNRLLTKPELRVSTPTGKTPLPFYKALRVLDQQGLVNAQEACFFQLDEYLGLPAFDPNSYRYYLDKELTPKFKSRYYLNPQALNLEKEAETYQKLLDDKPLDLMILGIGRDGHLAFNEPGSHLATQTRIIELDELTRADAAIDFGGMQNTPTKALTMGLHTMAEARELIVIITGESKQEAVYRLFNEEPSTFFPASLLRLHPRLTIIADQAACQNLAVSQPARRAYIVLGHRDGDSPEHRISPESYERLRLAERLARQDQNPIAILTGHTTNSEGLSEAEQMGQVWSVKGSGVLFETGAKDTAENAARSLRLVKALRVKEVVVVTSAWHLRTRYLFAAYRKHKLKVSHKRVFRKGKWLTQLLNELKLFKEIRKVRKVAYKSTFK